MADDLNRKLQAQLDGLRKDIDRLKRTNHLEAASVTSGRVRFIGGLLRVDSGGRVEIVGTLEIDGTTTVTGSFTVTGPWGLEGDGTITGDVIISGDVTSTGTLTQNGPWNMNGAGTIAGNVTQTGDTDQRGNVTVRNGGKITVKGGGGDVVLDSSYSDPRITLGSAQINGGTDSFTFTSGSQIVYFVNNTIRIPGMATKPVGDVPGGYVGGVWVDLAGRFYRLS
ncbi:hypothetical protein [Microbacterium sp. UFMG61]|uniref:hypothetical protein n=1 Tax=Microbacterium sp. UFMG61 TaxID=2745935 RepID=UPI00188E9C3D|nr:hypothetical protein [Microbacterium sp. UFMG61]